MSNTKLYNGDDIIKDVYYGNNIISKIYKGNEEIYNVYYDGETIFESSESGEYNFDIKVKGLYEITVVGAGGGTGVDYHNFSKWHGEFGTGGSGAGFRGIIYLTKGIRKITVGGGTIGQYGERTGVGGDGGYSEIQGIVKAGGGTGGWGDYSYADKAGQGGVITQYSENFKSIEINSNGNNGNYAEGAYLWGTWTGGTSVCDGYGVGGTAISAIGNRYNSAGSNGYVKIRYLHDQNN